MKFTLIIMCFLALALIAAAPVREDVIPKQATSVPLSSGPISIESTAKGPMRVRGESVIAHEGQIIRTEIWYQGKKLASWDCIIGALNTKNEQQTECGVIFDSSKFAGRNLEVKVEPIKVREGKSVILGATIERIK